ncbi:hypothetical protein [Candidatus Contubernalis alkaliaceticus]|uniref:hypothetical protein n=1 Tax=Candidatus Contubernalis alkaliaceticus TaxID=338645 RepID=UPI001F4C043C|nr:hypothetical protein [Candidatus Contubernalis alkalaceticus]UNC91638.1 hypothetical protein HUE98_05755 [Candidatus Contubernalis alkalaceticus]
MTDRQLLEAILNKISEIDANMATKKELAEVKANMATKDELAEVKADVKSIQEIVIKIENEHGQKLAALFDGYKHNSETLTDHTLRLERIEKKVATHDIQIHVLEKTKDSKQ